MKYVPENSCKSEIKTEYLEENCDDMFDFAWPLTDFYKSKQSFNDKTVSKKNKIIKLCQNRMVKPLVEKPLFATLYDRELRYPIYSGIY